MATKSMKNPCKIDANIKPQKCMKKTHENYEKSVQNGRQKASQRRPGRPKRAQRRPEGAQECQRSVQEAQGSIYSCFIAFSGDPDPPAA